MRTPDLPPILSVELMAEMLKCAESTVEDLARREELPGLKYGQGWIFPLDATLKVLNDRALARVKTTGAGAAPAAPVAVSLPAQARTRRAPPVLPNLGAKT